MEIPFHLIDVFAERPLTGNPVAVVPNADALGDELMADVAREFRQPETTFILHPTRAAAKLAGTLVYRIWNRRFRCRA